MFAACGVCHVHRVGLVALLLSLYTWRRSEAAVCVHIALRMRAPGRISSSHPRQEQVNSVMALFLEFLVQQWILAAALMVSIAMLIFHESRKSGPSLTPQQAILVVNGEEGVFVDLRDAAEFRKAHIVNAVNIPATKLPDRMVELEKFKDRPVVVLCKMGQQSGAAGKQLKAAGYTKVYKMTGGMMEWSNLQLPTVS